MPPTSDELVSCSQTTQYVLAGCDKEAITLVMAVKGVIRLSVSAGAKRFSPNYILIVDSRG